MPKFTPEQIRRLEDHGCKVSINEKDGSVEPSPIGTDPINEAIKFALGDLEPSNRPEDYRPEDSVSVPTDIFVQDGLAVSPIEEWEALQAGIRLHKSKQE